MIKIYTLDLQTDFHSFKQMACERSFSTLKLLRLGIRTIF